MATKNLKVTLPNGEIHYCYGVSAASKFSGIREATLRDNLQNKGGYNKDGITVEITDEFDKVVLSFPRPVRLIIKGKIVNE